PIGGAGNTDGTSDSGAANDHGAAAQIESPALVVSVLVGPGVPGPSGPPPLGGFVAQRVMLDTLLTAADGQRAGQFLVGRGDEECAPPEGEVLPSALAGRGRETVLPMQRTFDGSPGVAFVPQAETYSPLGERLASAGTGARETAPEPLLPHAPDKALRL